MEYIAIIPARFASTRFPGKPLAILGGQPVIQRVYEQVRSVLDRVYVATDDQRIYDAVTAFGGQAVMTRSDHKSGTDRICEALDLVGGSPDVVINVQGDEPFIQPSQLRTVMEAFDDPATQIATLGKRFESIEAVDNPNSPKIVLDNDGFALYFSRSPIPLFGARIGASGWQPTPSSSTSASMPTVPTCCARSRVCPVVARTGGEPGAAALAAKRLQDQGRTDRCRDRRHRHARRPPQGGALSCHTPSPMT